MITALAMLALATPWIANPEGDVWVYPNSSDPGTEPLLRAWGNGDKATDSQLPPGDEFSYSYLQFDLKDLPKGDLDTAQLTVVNIPNEALTPEVMKTFPLEAYGMKGTFTENKFSFADTTVGPTDALFGKATSEKIAEGIKLTINLVDEKGAFKKALEAARTSGKLDICLATRMSPAESRSFIYKVNSKEGPKDLRPSLRITLK